MLAHILFFLLLKIVTSRGILDIKLQIIHNDNICVCAYSLSHVQLSCTPWTAAYQDALSMGFPRQEYWNGLQFLPLRDLSNPGIKPASLASLA